MIPNWLPANEITIFAGRGGVGKSRMTLQIAQKVASGWPGYQWEQADTRPALKPIDYLQHGQKVVIASWEDDINEMSDRMHQNQKALGFAPYRRNARADSTYQYERCRSRANMDKFTLNHWENGF